MEIIGLTGKAGCGKDTVATLLQGMINPMHRHAFAGPLKGMLASIGMPEPENRALKEVAIPGYNFSWRDAAQKLGTEWGRELDPNLWLKIGEQRIIASVREGASVVITDVRFDNEAQMIRQLGGRIWHVTGRQAELGGFANHASEQGVLFYPMQDEILENNGTMDMLVARISKLLEKKA